MVDASDAFFDVLDAAVRKKSCLPPMMRYNSTWRAPAHCGMVNLVRSGTKQPQLFPASAADKARLLISILSPASLLLCFSASVVAFTFTFALLSLPVLVG